MSSDNNQPKSFRDGMFTGSGGREPDFFNRSNDAENGDAVAADTVCAKQKGVPVAELDVVLAAAEMVEHDNDEMLYALAATGRQMHDRLARSEPPHQVTLQGLPRRHQPRMLIDEALEARPEQGKSHGHR